MRPCWYAFQGVACILSPYGAFTEKPPALPGDVYSSSVVTESLLLLDDALLTSEYVFFSELQPHSTPDIARIKAVTSAKIFLFIYYTSVLLFSNDCAITPVFPHNLPRILQKVFP